MKQTSPSHLAVNCSGLLSPAASHRALRPGRCEPGVVGADHLVAVLGGQRGDRIAVAAVDNVAGSVLAKGRPTLQPPNDHTLGL